MQAEELVSSTGDVEVLVGVHDVLVVGGYLAALAASFIASRLRSAVSARCCHSVMAVNALASWLPRR